MAVITNVNRDFDFGTIVRIVELRVVRALHCWHALLHPCYAAAALGGGIAASGQLKATKQGGLKRMPRLAATRLERMRSSCRLPSHPRPTRTG